MSGQTTESLPLSRQDLLFAGFIGALAWVAFLWAYHFYGTYNLYEFAHYVDVARNWLGGDGYSTRTIEAATMSELGARGLPVKFPFPVTYRFPLQALLVSLSMRIFGISDFSAALVNGAVHATLAALIVILGSQLYGSRTARTAGLLYVLSPIFSGRYTISGLADPLFALLLFVLHFLLVRPGDWGRKTSIAAGAILGLAYLTRFNVTLFFPIYAVLVWRRTDKTAFGLFCLAAIAVLSPFCVYKLRHFGTLFFYPMAKLNLAAFTATSAAPWDLYQTFSLKDILMHSWLQVANKTLSCFFTEFIPQIMTIWSLPLLVLCFFAGFPGGEKGSPRRYFWILGAGLLLLQGIALSPLRLELLIPNLYYQGRYFFWFAPFLLLAGCHVFISRLPNGRHTIWFIAMFILFNFLTGFHALKAPGFHFDPEHDIASKAFAQLDPKNTVLVSNLSVQAAAYFRVNSIQLPWTPEELQRLAKDYPFNALYLRWEYFLADEWRTLLSTPYLLTQFQNSMGLSQPQMFINERGNIIEWFWIRRENQAATIER